MDDLWDEEPEWFENDDSEDEDEDGEMAGVPGAQHIVILLDCSSRMFQQTMKDPEFEDDKISAVDWSLQVIEKAVRSKIQTVTTLKTGKRDGLGVLLYNTKYRTDVAAKEDEKKQAKEETKEKNPDEDEEDDEEDDDDEPMGHTGPKMSTVHEFLPLAPPGVETVKAVMETLEEPGTGERARDLEDQYCAKKGDLTTTPSGDSSLQQALSAANEAFKDASCVKQKPTKNDTPDSKQIWIFTDDDDPLCGTEDAELTLKYIRTAVTDSQDNGVDLVVWPVTSSGKFDYSKFYDKIQLETPGRDADDASDLDELVKLLQNQWKKARRAFYVPLLLPNWKAEGKTKEDAHIVLDFYKLIQIAQLPKKVEIHQETGKVLSKIKYTRIGQTMLMKQNMFGPKKKAPTSDLLRSFAEFGSERVPMTALDKVAMKKQACANQDFASLILLGFKKNDLIPFYHVLDENSSYFVYPNDDSCEGSTDAFAHLHASMLRKGVVAIGELLTRTTASSRLVVITPLREVVEEVDVDGHVESSQVRPPGMLVMPMAYEDEIRSIEPDFAARTLQKSGMDAAPEELVDAAIELVQGQSLGEDVEIGGVEHFQNASMLKFWDYVEHVALGEPLGSDKKYDTVVDKDKVLKEVGEQIEKFSLSLPADVKPEKATKKRKIVPDDSGIDWEVVFTQGSLAQCKNNDLKSKLRSFGAPVSGNKAELVERLSALLEKEFSGGEAAIKKEE